MKEVILAYTFAAAAMVVAAAPTLTPTKTPDIVLTEQQLQDFLRDKRSQYIPQYVSPCAAAAANPGFAPAGAYPVNMGYHGGYSAPHSYVYGGPHYRADDHTEEQEMLNFSDMDHFMTEHMPMARYGAYAVPTATHFGFPGPGFARMGYDSQMVAPAASASSPAFGVFPNANVGGCGVPLLFSCSPSIVKGRILQPQAHHAYGSGADSYRGVELVPHLESHEEHHEKSSEHEHTGSVHDATHPVVHQ